MNPVTGLNYKAHKLVQEMIGRADELRCTVISSPTEATLIDCGFQTTGSLEAGMHLARICLSDLGQVALRPGNLPGCPLIEVSSHQPVLACLASQYAGWQLQITNYFAMASGPMRAAYAREPLYSVLNYREQSEIAVGILEAKDLPTAEVLLDIANKCHVPPKGLFLLAAPTTSLAGTLQVVARSVETALHKLHELQFDLNTIISAYGTAPLPPVARKTSYAIGNTNDAILYGGDVTLWVRCDEEVLDALGPQVPASASRDYGLPFAQLLERAGGDFYQIDPLLFSPARITFHNLQTGRSHTFGQLNLPFLEKNWGLI